MELDKTPVMQLRLGLWVRFGSIKNPAEEREIYVSILNQAPVVAQREARSRPMLARGLTHFAIRDHYFAGHAICAANARTRARSLVGQCRWNDTVSFGPLIPT